MENDECFRKAAKGDAHEVGIADVKVSAGSREEGREDMTAANNPKNVMESTRKNSIIIFGTEHFLDEYTKRRIAIGEFGTAFFGLASIFALTFDTVTKDVPAEIVLGAFILAMFFLSMVCYKNVSFVILKRLFLEPNIILILLLALGNVAVDVARPSSPFSWAYGVLYLSQLFHSYLSCDTGKTSKLCHISWVNFHLLELSQFLGEHCRGCVVWD